MSEREEREMREQLNRIEKQLTRLETHLNGGDEPANGIIVRLDRVEQRQASQIKAFWLAASSFFVAITSVAVRLLSIGPTPK